MMKMYFSAIGNVVNKTENNPLKPWIRKPKNPDLIDRGFPGIKQ